MGDAPDKVSPVNRTNRGAQDIRAGLPMLREAAQMGDLERVLSWAVGLSFPGCLRAAPSTAGASVADLTNVAERIYHPVASGYSFGCLTQELADPAKCPITTRL